MAGAKDPNGTLSGARSSFLIDGRPVGYAAGVAGGEEIQYEAVDVLDLLEVREWIPVAYRATLSAQMFRLVGKSLKQQSIFPSTPGGAADDISILTSGDLECVLTDKVTSSTYARFIGVKTASHDFDVTARGIVQDNITFVCIRLKDEFESNV